MSGLSHGVVRVDQENSLTSLTLQVRDLTSFLLLLLKKLILMLKSRIIFSGLRASFARGYVSRGEN